MNEYMERRAEQDAMLVKSAFGNLLTNAERQQLREVNLEVNARIKAYQARYDIKTIHNDGPMRDAALEFHDYLTDLLNHEVMSCDLRIRVKGLSDTLLARLYPKPPTEYTGDIFRCSGGGFTSGSRSAPAPRPGGTGYGM